MYNKSKLQGKGWPWGDYDVLVLAHQLQQTYCSGGDDDDEGSYACV